MSQESGKRLRDRREELQLTMQDVADRAGYTSKSRKTVIYHLELGNTEIALTRLPAFASALETNIYYLLGMTSEKNLTDDVILKMIESRHELEKTNDVATEGKEVLADK